MERPTNWHSSALCVLALLISLSACSEETVAPRPPEYNRCDSDADCSAVTPRCRALDLSASGHAAKVCVKECDLEAEALFHECPRTGHSAFNIEEYRCVGVNASGHLDPTSSDGVCARLCDDPGPGRRDQPHHCVISLGDDDPGRNNEGGVCARLEYDGWTGTLLFCLEPDTPLPAPIVPRYRDCTTSSDCSAITPECRATGYDHMGRDGGRFCTLACERDEDCPIDPHRREGPVQGRCLGLGADGLFDPQSTDKICFPGCIAELCTLGAGTPEEKLGTCATVDPTDNEEYGWFCI